LRLQVTVNHAFRVGGFQGPAYLQHDSRRLLGRKFTSFQQQFTEVLPLHKIHGDEFDSVGLPQVENTNDILVRNLASEN